MTFTDIGSNAGKVYDTDEAKRLADIANTFERLAQKEDDTNQNVKRKKIITYAIIIGGSVLLLVALRLLVKKK
jgi:hypothetical protein